MNNAGTFVLFASEITTALTAEATTPIEDLDGMLAANITARFQYGSGGTSLDAIVQTSFDGGTLWADVAHFAFTTESSLQYCNLSGLTYQAVVDYEDLPTQGQKDQNDALLGPMFRVVLDSVGTYADGTLLVMRLTAR